MSYYKEDERIDRRKALFGIGAFGVIGASGAWFLSDDEDGPSAAANTPDEL